MLSRIVGITREMGRRMPQQTRAMGAGPTKKRSSGHKPQHLSQAPRFEPLEDYSSLDLKYPVDATKQFVVETRGWAPPPTTRPDLPFAVDRAGVGQGVPVYTDYKAGGTKVVTITRKVRGDVLLLAEELQKIVGDETEVRIHAGRLEVDGNYEKRIKKWLIGMGF